jgi:hypothetical protein
VEAADKTQISTSIIFMHPVRIEVLDLQNDWLIPIMRKFGIDPLAKGQHIGFELFILRYESPARCGDLGKRECADPLRVPFQEPFHGE